MNIFWFSSVVLQVSALIVGVLTLLRSNNKVTNTIFALMSLSFAVWGIGSSVFSRIPIEDYREAMFWWQFSYTGVIASIVFYAHFTFRYLNIHKRKFLLLIYLVGLLFMFLNWYSRSSLFLGDLRFVFNQFYWHDWISSSNPIFLIFHVGFYLLLSGYCFVITLKHFRKTTGLVRNQLKYIIFGSIFVWLGGALNFSIDYGFNIYPFGNFIILPYVFVFAYATAKYRLLDIRVAITRAGVFILVYTLVLGAPFAAAIWFKDKLVDILGSQWWMFPFGLLAFLATGGPFLYIYIQRQAENRLFKEQKRYQDTLKQASVGMTRIRDLRKLLDLIAHIVTKTVKISYAAIYLLNEDTEEYTVQVSRDKGRIPLQKIASDNPLIQWIVFKREPIIYDEVKRLMEDTHNETYRHLEENMRLLTASVIIPSFLEDKFIGFFVLGDKISGEIYTIEDLNVFQVLASQAALAIENAEFYEEAKEMQDQIAQAEKMATIGTMADGLSHQINNRFHALSLIAADTIDTIKTTDTASCSPEMQEMIKKISYALERVEANVMQGAEVVKGILKYSRKGEQGLTALDLDQIIDGTLEMVQFKVKLNEIDFIRNYSKDIPKIKGNLVQLEEAFFNFIDNAYDAIVERRTLLKEAGYKGKITVTATPKDKSIEIVVEDNGMGVKEEDAKKVFTPFFTTKISARKGTGLGLYVIKKIITDAHKGKINFESAYQVGTRFILELPTTS